MQKRFVFIFFFFVVVVDVFSQQDSLFDWWNQRLDAINLSTIDMLPIYRFTLEEVRNEVKQYVNTENQESDNAVNQKLSDLNGKINHLSTILGEKLRQMDSLFFAKALQLEQQGNEEDAVFYYKRSLDFNPSYCLSIEKLGSIYAKNGQNKQYIELLKFLTVYNQLKTCSLQIFNTAFDSLHAQSNRLIQDRNYYDALKVLDTLKLFLDYIPQEKQVWTYRILLELAQNGIYASYYEIIDKSININELSLAQEYIFGLFLAIENNNQPPNQNFFFLSAVQNLIFAHRSNANRDIEQKQYDKAIETTDSILLFLNGLNYFYADNLFFDIYTARQDGEYSNWMEKRIQKYASEAMQPNLTEQITPAAFFQKEKQDAQDMLEMGYFSEGFDRYNQAYAHYKAYEIEQYGLECDNLWDFVEKLNQENYFRQLTLYYIEKHLCADAIKSLFHTVNKGMGDKQWQAEVGQEMKKVNCCQEFVKKQCFTKEYKPFLAAYFGEKDKK